MLRLKKSTHEYAKLRSTHSFIRESGSAALRKLEENPKRPLEEGEDAETESSNHKAKEGRETDDPEVGRREGKVMGANNGADREDTSGEKEPRGRDLPKTKKDQAALDPGGGTMNKSQSNQRRGQPRPLSSSLRRLSTSEIQLENLK